MEFRMDLGFETVLFSKFQRTVPKSIKMKENFLKLLHLTKKRGIIVKA